MLLQFKVQNRGCFRDEIVLDFTAADIEEHPDHVVEMCGEKILPAAAVYGANASGKSSLIDALFAMSNYVEYSALYGGMKNSEQVIPVPFMLDEESMERPSLFEASFISTEKNGSRFYQYGFKLSLSGKVLEEWLNEKTETDGEFHPVLYRDAQRMDLPGIPEKLRENLKVSINPETLLVSLGAVLKVEKLKEVYDWFSQLTFMDFGNPELSTTIYFKAPYRFEDRETQEDVVKYLSAFDPSIAGFRIEEIPSDDSKSNNKQVHIKSLHYMNGSQKPIYFPFEWESAGTQKMFSLYQNLKAALDKGGVLIIDELASELHPLLLRNFLATFLNPAVNTRHAQILFTTHDPWQLSSGLLRRDEVWFTEKGGDGACTLYSMADFVDEDGNIFQSQDWEDDYLIGRFGAIPHMKPLFSAVSPEEGAEKKESGRADEPETAEPGET